MKIMANPYYHTETLLEQVTYTNAKIQTKISIIIEAKPGHDLGVAIHAFSKIHLYANRQTNG